MPDVPTIMLFPNLFLLLPVLLKLVFQLQQHFGNGDEGIFYFL
jgi:hypothetical protein